MKSFNIHRIACLFILAIALSFSACHKEVEKLPDGFITIPTLATEDFHFFPADASNLVKGQKFDFYLNVTPKKRVGFSKRAGELMYGKKNILMDLYPDSSRGNTLAGAVRGLVVEEAGTIPIEIRVEGGRVFQGSWTVSESKPEEVLVKNIIIAIDDGAGAALKAAARKALGKDMLESDKLPVSGKLSSTSQKAWAADSAALSTAFATGQMGDNGQLSVFPDHTPREPMDNPKIDTLAELLAKNSGKAIGLVTTTKVTDATTAAWVTHLGSRNRLRSIAENYVDVAENGNLRVLMGGDKRSFKPNRKKELDDLGYAMRQAGFVLVTKRGELLQEMNNPPERLLGLFHNNHMSSELDRLQLASDDARYGEDDQPQLMEMTKAALKVLERNEEGFILIVEAGIIEKMLQLQDGHRAMYDELEFDKTVGMLHEYVKGRDDTLLISTSGHETASVGAIGVTTPRNLGTKKYVSPKTKIEYKDRDLDGFPDKANPTSHFAFDFAARVDRHENWAVLSRVIPPAMATEKGVMANPNRKLRFSKVITGNLPDAKDGGEEHVLAPPVANDVRIAAAGPGAEIFAGHQNATDIFYKLLDLSLGVKNKVAAMPALPEKSKKAANVIFMLAEGAGNGLYAIARAVKGGDKLALDDLTMQGMLSTAAEKTLAVAIEDSSAAILCGSENFEDCKGLGPQLSASGEMVWGYIGTDDKSVSALKLAGAENAIPSKELGLQYIRKIKGKRELVFRGNGGDMQATLADEMTEALAAMPEDKRFALLVEYGSMVSFLEQADAERAANQFLDFDSGVKAALAYIRRVNSDDNPANDTLLVVASTADLGGIAGIGVTRRMHKLPSVRDDITSAKGKPDYQDKDGNGFPDTWDNDHRVVAGWISRVKHRDDRLPNPEFLPMDKRDPNGIVIDGNTYADTVQCILADVPVAAEGPGAEMFMGLTRNTKLAEKIKKALGL